MKDQEIVMAVATTVMEWKRIDPEGDDLTDEEKNCQTPLVMIADGNIEKGIIERRRNNSIRKINWTIWNPLADPSSWYEVLQKLAAHECFIKLNIDADGVTCKISSPINEMEYESATPGKAVCMAALLLMKDLTS